MKHSREPWEYRGGSYNTMITSGGKYIAGSLPGVPPAEERENLHRIVACVNACAGIRSQALESGLIKYLLNDAYMRTINPLLPNPQRKQDMTYLGKPVYEEDFEEEEDV